MNDLMIEQEREIEPLQLEEMKDEDMTSRKQIRELKKNEVDEEKKEREAGYLKAKAKEEVKNRGLRTKHADVPQEGVYDDPLLSDTLLRARKVVLGQRKQTIDEVKNVICFDCRLLNVFEKNEKKKV